MSKDANRLALPFERSLGYQIRATHRAFQSYLASRIEPHGVTLGMWYFLRVLWREDGLTQRELSLRAGTMEPTTLTALRGMERSGLVERRRDRLDGRKQNVFLTDKGRALEEVLIPLAHKIVEDAAQGIAQDDRDRLIGLLLRMRGNIDAVRGEDASAAVVLDTPTG